MAAILSFAAMTIFSSCKEPDPIDTGNDPEEIFTNEFICDGKTAAIGSAVRFDQDNNTVQFWLSSKTGLTTVDEIEDAGEHLIVSIHKSYLGATDRFTKAGSFILYGDKGFSAGDEGMGYIEASMTGDELKLRFAVEHLSTKDTSAPVAELQGNFNGECATFSEAPLDNQWAVNRERAGLKSAVLTAREDGGCDTYALYEEDGSLALSFTLPQSRRGLPTIFNTRDEVFEGFEVKYGDGKEMPAGEVYGTVTAMPDEDGMRVSFDMTCGNERVRAEYDGEYQVEVIKSNRYIYYSGYPSGSNYDGTFYLEYIKASTYNGVITFKFVTVDTYEILAHLPKLMISDQSLIGKTDIDLRNTSGWHFEFDKFNVEAYENEWKPAPVEGSTLTILETDEGYYIDLELASEDPSFKYVSTIDLHYVGEVIWE